MKQTTRIAIAQLLSAAGSVLSALAAEFQPSTPADPEPEAPVSTDPEKPKRGRKPAAAAPAPQEPAQPETPAEPEPVLNGKTYEDMKLVIKPYVEAERGAEVKSVIAKFAPSLREMDPKHYPAFEAAIAALPAKTDDY